MALLPSALRSAREWGECALSLAFPWPELVGAEAASIEPPFCHRCGLPFASMGEVREATPFLCGNCQERKWSFAWARSGYRAEGEVLDAIIGFKYREEYYQHRRLSAWLTDTFDRHGAGESWDGLVPVPLYHRRYRERGFNQAMELARSLGKERRIPVSAWLCRCRETPSQTGLNRPARWENMAGAFRIKRRFDVKGKNLLLIDDVFTTGATTNACAQVLARAGANLLAVLTVARS